MRSTGIGRLLSLLWSCVFLWGGAALAQVAPPPDLPRIGGSLVTLVRSLPHLRPDTLGDFATSPDRLVQVRTFVDALARHDWAAARQHAQSLRYQVGLLDDGGSLFVVASDGAGRDATVVLNLSPRRDLVIEAPHVPFEAGTAEQAVLTLRDAGGRAAILAGAHRCASRAFAGCSGKTAVCGTLQAYRDSDVGHNVNTVFHAAHLALAGLWRSSVVVSLHGMKEDADGVRTAMIVSSGIRAEDAEARLPASRFRVLAQRALPARGEVVSCNLPQDAVFEYRKLCGFTNVQGRQVNGGANVCTESVDQGTGRFVHVEQDWSVLGRYADNAAPAGPGPLHAALVDAFSQIAPAVAGR